MHVTDEQLGILLADFSFLFDHIEVKNVETYRDPHSRSMRDDFLMRMRLKIVLHDISITDDQLARVRKVATGPDAPDPYMYEGER